MQRRTPWMLALAMLAGHAHAACLSDAQVVLWAEGYMARKPVPQPPAMSEAHAHCTRAKLQAQLTARLGPPIGYKVGLTNPAIRRMLKADAPVWGAFYKGDFDPSGQAVPANFGARPTVEADLLVRVGSAQINSAETPEEVLAALDQVIPFIELPDMQVSDPTRLGAHEFSAINAGARGGVIGSAVPVPADAAGRRALFEALGTMRVVITDGEGKLLGEGRGADLLGHPMASALWLVKALRDAGTRLEPGHLLSLGSFPPVISPRAGLLFQVRYDGLPGAAPVAVRFVP